MIFSALLKNIALRLLLSVIFIFLNITLFGLTLPAKQRAAIEKQIAVGAYPQALETIGGLSGRYPEDAEVYLLKGICFYNMDDHKKKAVDVLETALNKTENKNIRIDILYHIAQAYTANKDYINTIKTYNQLQKIVPPNSDQFLQHIETQIDYYAEMLEKHGVYTSEEHKPLDTNTGKIITTEAPPANIPASQPSAQTPKHYTIQICTMSFPLSDNFFKGQYKIKLIKTGDLYRYIYSMYNSVQEARADLPKVRKIYPDAYIREYDEKKLGKAIDMNIDHIE